LSNGTGTNGHEYSIAATGYANLGVATGNIQYVQGGFVIYGANVWNYTPSASNFTALYTNTHLSVNNNTGNILISTDATPTSTANAIVSRDANGNFGANTITATLVGSATSAGTAGTVTAGSQTAITQVGTLTSLTVSGNLTVNAPSYIIANGALLTALPGYAYSNVNTAAYLSTATITTTGTVSDRYGSLRSIPLNTQSSAYILTANDNGNLVSITTGNVTVNAGVFGSPFGQAISVFNNSANVMYVVQGTSVTLRLAGTATTGTRSLARYGLASLVCVAANTFVISGAGIS
jgi:hypothetical protein